MKRDEGKTKEQLINKLEEMRQRIVNLKALGHKREEEIKLESADKHRDLAESLSELIYCADPKTFEATYVNSAIESFYGYTVAEWLNDPSLWKNLIHPDDKEMVLAEFAEARKNMVNAIIEYRIVRKDKTFRWVEDHITWQKDQHGKAFSINGVMYDVTEHKHLEQRWIRHRDHLEELVEERTAELESSNEQLQQEITKHKQTEKVLRESKELFKKTFATQRDAIFILDAMDPPNIIDCNPKAIETFGYTRREMLGRTTAFLHVNEPTLKEFQELLYPNIEKDGFLYLPEFAMKRKDGTVFPTEHSVAPLKDKQEKRIGWVSVVKDIAKRKQSESALIASEERFRNLFQLAPDAVFALDTKGKVMAVNPAALNLTGFSEDEIVGKHFSKLPTARLIDIPKYVKMLGSLLKGEPPKPFEAAFYTRDGQCHWGEVHIGLIKSMGKITGIQAVTRDITKRKQSEEKLGESEQRYRQLFEGISDAVIVYSSQGMFLDCNEVTLQRLGYSHAEFLRLSPTDIVHPDYHQIMRDNQKRIWAGETTIVESVHRSKDGRFIPVEITARKIEYQQQPAILAVVHDITERKQTEESLQESEATKRVVMNATPDAIAVVDKNGIILDINESMAKYLGKQREELIGIFGWDLVPPDVAKNRRGHFNKVFQTGKAVRFEDQNKGVYFDNIVYPILEEEGKVIRVAVNSRNITKHKRAEEKIQIQRAHFVSIFERSLEGIVTLDINNNILEANKGFDNIFGYKQKEIIGKRLDDLVVPERLYGEAKELDKMALVGIRDYETVRKRKNGTEINVSLSAGPIKMGEEVRGCFVILRDITERKVLEEEYQKTVRLESVGTLAGGIAHDFNNLLTGIMGNISLAKRYIEPKSKIEERLLEAEKASLRAKDLTQQLLTFARGGTPIKKIISISELMRISATFALRGSNTRCVFSLPDDLWPVEADEGQLNQVITNIVLNADEAMPQGGILNIGAKNTVIQKGGALPLPKGNYIEIIIADHGIGIPQEHLSRIFDPYFTTKQKGIGLGLATAYSIIKNHGGYISAESTPTVGTTFHIYLHASKKRMPRKEQEATVPPALLGKGRILVMDDEEIIRQLLDDELTGVGYEVELTVDGAEAIEHYQIAKESGQPFDAVILDLTIPGGMGGKEAIKKLLEIDPGVKAIVSSGYSTDPIMSDFKYYGFSGVVAKPYEVEQLEEILHSLLTKR